AFEQEVPLVEMRDRLAASLDEFEGEFTAQIGQPFAFDEKPLDLRRLSVVAFLQDDATRKVLQAAVVPIEQEVELPPLTAERAGEDGTTDAATEAAESAEGPSLAPPE
ncbi:MAG TPA: hypothetical protein VF170_00360, partial [Planctomycetaceae bacterium]